MFHVALRLGPTVVVSSFTYFVTAGQSAGLSAGLSADWTKV